MIKYCKFLILLIIFSNTRDKAVLGQKKSDLTPSIIVEDFIGIIGGEKWLGVKSRKEYALVEYIEDKNSIIPIKSYNRIKIDVHSGKSLEVHRDLANLKSILVYKPECNWYYSSGSQIVKFFGPEPIKFKTTFPRTELMEVLNLEPLKTVYMEDTLYRVDFKDSRQLDGIQSMFFGMNSGLLYKRTFTSKNEVHWEYHFSNYREFQGFSEPHIVRLTSNGKDYFTILVESILYNVAIDANAFDPPIPCKNYDDFKHLEFPYLLDIN